MARRKDKEKAIKLRLQNKSYSEIKEKLGISKSTLSNWLHDYPLPPEIIKKLRDNSPKRIENFRNTMRKKREARLEQAYILAKKDISKLNKKDIFTAGFFLYWAEGSKTPLGEICLANTDPSMLKFFIKWLKIIGIDKKKIRAKLHLYSDMNIKKQTLFWSKELDIPLDRFRKPYIKESKLSDVKYKNGFGQGTCNVKVSDQERLNYVLMGTKYIKDSMGI